MQKLHIKIGVSVTLIFNIDTGDSLTNGVYGEIFGYERNKTGAIFQIIVHLYNPEAGKVETMQCSSSKVPWKIANSNNSCLISLHYVKKNYSTSAMAKVIQFPLKFAFAATAHKKSRSNSIKSSLSCCRPESPERACSRLCHVESSPDICFERTTGGQVEIISHCLGGRSKA